MSEVIVGSTRGRFRAALDFVKSAEPRRPVSRRALVIDFVIAATLLAGALYRLQLEEYGAIAALLICGSLAVRRVFPLSVFFSVLAVAFAARNFATYVTFIAIVLAAYSAVVHSRYRGAALITMAPAGLLVGAVFWKAASNLPHFGPLRFSSGSEVITRHAHGSAMKRIVPIPVFPGHVTGLTFEPTAPWRLTGLLVFVSLASIAIVGVAVYAADRIRLMKAEHQAATRRAVELERARIASELHDVVTHNVSMMIVQAGAARQVLSNDPGQAKDAMLAVETSGRAAMTELRHLLGLLSPPSEDHAGAGPAGPGNDLTPQPGLGQIDALVRRVADTGLPVTLETGSLPDGLPPGADLAAFRVVQEALTNVIKHVGKPETSVKLDYSGGDLIVEVRDAGRLIPAAGPVVGGAGRGLLGLRERVTIYGGELQAGPRPAGGWLVRARIPADPMTAPVDALANVAAAVS